MGSAGGGHSAVGRGQVGWVWAGQGRGGGSGDVGRWRGVRSKEAAGGGGWQHTRRALSARRARESCARGRGGARVNAEENAKRCGRTDAGGGVALPRQGRAKSASSSTAVAVTMGGGGAQGGVPEAPPVGYEASAIMHGSEGGIPVAPPVTGDGSVALSLGAAAAAAAAAGAPEAHNLRRSRRAQLAALMKKQVRVRGRAATSARIRVPAQARAYMSARVC